MKIGITLFFFTQKGCHRNTLLPSEKKSPLLKTLPMIHLLLHAENYFHTPYKMYGDIFGHNFKKRIQCA